ncbi:DUF3060 domain-containing protein [Sphingobium sp. WCS2017Hpa-17]|uniref:DUF3060 domain-containing protein n=1 Tax=Sphingobium sp. WCS2017Hpa-17 TaxID=3073638 RepID=UPI002889B635|nr:DUF3060 domain-containing protein [Sphingobium sp. WCS2017Hpa-17]
MANESAFRIIAASAALFACAAVMTPAHAQAVLEGSGENSTLDCAGGRASVTGTNNQVTVEGACTHLTVEGSGNVVTAQMAAQSTIKVEGISNKVNWRTPGKTAPKISSAGVGNSVTRAR